MASGSYHDEAAVIVVAPDQQPVRLDVALPVTGPCAGQTVWPVTGLKRLLGQRSFDYAPELRQVLATLGGLLETAGGEQAHGLFEPGPQLLQIGVLGEVRPVPCLLERFDSIGVREANAERQAPLKRHLLVEESDRLGHGKA